MRPGFPSRFVLAVLLSLAGFARAAGAVTPPDIMPFKEVTTGMKGVGRTVFKGTTPEEFNVEIIATMENILPKKNLILARLEGGPLRDSGILEGMSGSPVYIDGRLVGAVAYSWGFAKEPICGITPIEEMLSIYDKGLDLPATTGASPSGSGALAPSGTPRSAPPAPFSMLFQPDRMVEFMNSWQRRLIAPAPAPAGLQPLRPMLAFSGFDPDVARASFAGFEALAMHPVMAGSPALAAAAADAPLVPGSAFGVALVRGDLDITAVGTITHVDGDRV